MGGQKGSKPLVHFEEIYRLHQEGMSIYDIHIQLNVSRAAIEKYLRVAGLEPNTHKRKKREQSRSVVCVELGLVFDSMRDAACYLRPQHCRISNRGLASAIRKCCKDQNKKCYGFTWKFKENENSTMHDLR